MNKVIEILRSHPQPQGLGTDRIIQALPAIMECAAACTACADACLGEEEMLPKLRHCITGDLACANSCQATAALLMQQTKPDPEAIRASVEACRVAASNCAAECEKHAGKHAHCKHCAEACRGCESACGELLALER